MNKKKLLILIGIIIVLGIAIAAYQHFSANTIEKKIGKLIDKNCKDVQSCTVKVSDATNFDWDTMYYFEMAMTKNDVEKIMNVPVENFRPGQHAVIFLKNNKIVYTEYFPSDAEGYKDNEVVFRGIKDNYGKYSSGTIFRAGKNELTSHHYYELDPVTN